MATLARNYDWSTSPLGTPEQWPTSLQTLVNMMLTSRFPMLIFWGPELITFYNDAFRPSLGDNGKHPASLGQRGPESWAESWPVIGHMIYDIMAGGESVWYEDQKLPLYRDGRMGYAYWTYSFSPLADNMGTVNGILVTCSETTDAVINRQKLEASENRFRSIIDQTPAATMVLRGDNFVIEQINASMLELMGQSEAVVIGSPLLAVMPELEHEFAWEQVQRVYHQGISYDGIEVPVTHSTGGVISNRYYNLAYRPLEEDGRTTGVIQVVTDVTKQVLDRQKLEETEAGLRGAVELAQLGTWSVDVATNGLTYSDRLIDWFGYDPGEQDYSQVIPILEADDQERVSTAVAWALNPESNGIYDEIYTVIHPKTGKKRILHAQGKTVFDATGKAVRMNGTAQDITIQWELQMALENEVQQRTQELAIKLRELQEVNRLLNRSNENLQRFAYVASHDLQEPLRKIQQFGDLLRTRYAEATGDELTYIQRMQSAASRMSTLIRDLLSFSRVSVEHDTSTAVPLNNVVHTVLTDLELVIAETGAVINVASLPTVWGDATQLGQLLQNLLSNALKFRRAGIAPLIEVNARPVEAAALPPSVKPARDASTYLRIDVVDNGIGFDEKYVDRIFEVFQRLHGKSEFTGTGIGLAICERVAANHGGAITATSKPGQGSTFSIYLPY